jgi:HJR/Mrr/RecB family endonuclease
MNKTKEITQTIASNPTTQRTIFRVLVGALVLLSVVYVYVIGSITFNVLARKSLESTVHTLGSHISELELTYLSNANKIDKSFALSKGYVETHQSVYAVRGEARVALR